MNDLEINNSTFEIIKHIDEEGREYWYGRELGKILQYGEYRKFLPVIKKAIIACANSDYKVSDHFVQMDVMVDIGSRAKRKLKDYKLSRYACYLIVQNSDSTKSVVALGQTYFAVQTRKQELNEMDYDLLSEDEKRLYRRNQTKSGNYSLNQTAMKAGVNNFDKFHNSGYKGLYGGETAEIIA